MKNKENATHPTESEPTATGQVSTIDNKTRITEIILNAVLLGLLIISAICSVFLPIVRFNMTDSEVGVNLSSFDSVVGFVKAVTEPQKLVEEFESNDGKSLLVYDEVRHKTIRNSPSEEQILNDVAFKRTLGADHMCIWFNRITPFFCITADKYKEALELYKKAAGNTPGDQSLSIELFKKQLNAEYDELCKVANFFHKEIEFINYDGLKAFIDTTSELYKNSDEFTAENVNVLQDKYLVGKVNFDELKKLYDETNVANTETYFPGYADIFEINAKGEITTNLQFINANYYLNINRNEISDFTSGLLTYCNVPQPGFFGFFWLVFFFGFFDLLWIAIWILPRLIRAIKGKPRKLPKKENKHFEWLITIGMIVSVIGVWLCTGLFAKYVLSGLLEASLITGVAVLIILLTVLIMALVIYYALFIKKHPSPTT